MGHLHGGQVFREVTPVVARPSLLCTISTDKNLDDFDHVMAALIKY